MTKNKLTLGLSLLLSVPFINACGENSGMHELKQQVSEQKQAVANNMQKIIPESKNRLTKVSYQPGSRSPFEMTPTVSNMKGDAQPLAMFALNALRFVGVIEQGEKKWAVIITPDNLTYKVTVGDILGDHYGRIISVEANQIQVKESFSENGKAPTEKVVVMQLKEEH